MLQSARVFFLSSLGLALAACSSSSHNSDMAMEDGGHSGHEGLGHAGGIAAGLADGNGQVPTGSARLRGGARRVTQTA